MEMTAMVIAVMTTRTMERCACAPSALYASSGPYADEERPSAPRPTHARKDTRETWWKIRGSLTSRGGPMIMRRMFRIFAKPQTLARPGRKKVRGDAKEVRKRRRALRATHARREHRQPGGRGHAGEQQQ